jgi:hypothetical protein
MLDRLLTTDAFARLSSDVAAFLLRADVDLAFPDVLPDFVCRVADFFANCD